MPTSRLSLCVTAIAAGAALCAAEQTAPPLDRAALAASVRDEFVHAWGGFSRYAWGHDELLACQQDVSGLASGHVAHDGG